MAVTSREPAWRRALPLLAVGLAAFAAHATALPGGFLWLDHGDLEQGAAIAPPSQWLLLFTKGFARTGFYRPLMALSLSADALVGAPWFFHGVNLLAHASAAVLCVLTARALGLSRRAALAGGLLFGLHPVTALVSSAIAYRSEALVTVGLLGLLLAHRARRPALAALAVAVAALSKETGLVLAPLFIVAWELRHLRFPRGGAHASDSAHTETRGGTLLAHGTHASDSARAENRGGWLLAHGTRASDRAETPGSANEGGRRWPVLLAEALALAACLGLRLLFAPPWRSRFPELTALEAVGTRLAAAGKHVLALLWPLDFSVCDALPRSGVAAPLAVLGLMALLALGWAALRGPLLWRLGFLAALPALQLVPAPRFWSPHYLYLPFALLAPGLAALLLRARAGWAIGAALLVAFAGLSLRAGERYQSDEALFGPDVTAHPACREGRLYLGDAAAARGEWEAAAGHYEAVLSPDARSLSYADEPAALQNLGAVRLRQGRFAAAESSFRAALARTSDARALRQLVHNLAAAVFAQGRAGEAERLLAPESERTDALPASLMLRARALDLLGRSHEAAALRRRFER